MSVKQMSSYRKEEEDWDASLIRHKSEGNLTSRVCSWKCLRGLAWGGAATSHTLMLPSPQEDTKMFSFSCIISRTIKKTI